MATLTETVEQHERAAPEPKNMSTQVLVVDDEPVVTEVVERYLRLDGYEVSLASDGAVALQLAQEWAPDLVILDIMLPAVDGIEVCRQIRNESQVPIIVLTTSELSLHRCPAAKARRVATPSNSGHSAHGSWRQVGGV